MIGTNFSENKFFQKKFLQKFFYKNIHYYFELRLTLTLCSESNFLPNTELHSISDFLFQRVSQISKILKQVLSHFCICNKSL